MGGTCLITDLLTKVIFSKVILSPNFRYCFQRKVGLSDITGI